MMLTVELVVEVIAVLLDTIDDLRARLGTDAPADLDDRIAAARAERKTMFEAHREEEWQ